MSDHAVGIRFTVPESQRQAQAGLVAGKPGARAKARQLLHCRDDVLAQHGQTLLVIDPSDVKFHQDREHEPHSATGTSRPAG